jgi:hypothetical protein
MRPIAIFAAAFVLLAVSAAVAAQTAAQLKPNSQVSFVLNGKQVHEYDIAPGPDDICNITTDAKDDSPLIFDVIQPNGEPLVKEADASKGYVFVADRAGTYKLRFYVFADYPDDELAKRSGTKITVRYSTRFTLPPTARTKATRTVNGYQAKIADETVEDGGTYLVIQKGGKLRAVMRAEREITGGFYFSDDPNQLDGANAKASAALMRTTADKTGDGTPDIAVEYYSGGAHCCFEITFFELGERVRQLPTIGTDNDRMTAFAKKPGGGLRFRFAEQVFAYWNINFAQSPMPTVTYEFDKADKLVPRFDLMRKPAPTLAKLRRDAAAMKVKINLNPYVSPEDNINDWEEPFWGDMLDLIYTGHEDLAWQYFDLVWPAKKAGKAKFLSDFKEQLALGAWAEWKKQR